MCQFEWIRALRILLSNFDEAVLPNKALQPTFLPSLRYGKNAAELERWAARDCERNGLLPPDWLDRS